MTDHIGDLRNFIDLAVYYSSVKPEEYLTVEPEITYVDTIEPVKDIEDLYDNIEDLRYKLVNFTILTDNEDYNKGYDEAIHFVVNNLNRILQKYHSEKIK